MDPPLLSNRRILSSVGGLRMSIVMDQADYSSVAGVNQDSRVEMMAIFPVWSPRVGNIKSFQT